MDSFKLIAIDLDDTLLNDEYKVSERAIRTIKAAKEKGVHVTIATGRMYCSALPYAKALGIDVPLITYQGALIKNSLSGEILVERPVPLTLAREIITLAKAKGYHVNIYLNDQLYVEEINEEALLYSRISGASINPVGDLLEFLHDDPTKVLIITSEEKVQAFKAELKNKFRKEDVHITTSKPYFLEFLHPEANKASALEHLARLYGINREEIMALGDSYNDLEMLDYAGLGVVMGNAKEEIKKVADFVAPSNEEDGVATAIEKFVLKGGVSNGGY